MITAGSILVFPMSGQPTVKAIYKNGGFRPVRLLMLSEDQVVELTVSTEDTAETQTDHPHISQTPGICGGSAVISLAKDISVPPRKINKIVQGKRSITADTALRLSRYFGLSERFWMNLQVRYDLETEKERLEKRLNQEVTVLASQGEY